MAQLQNTTINDTGFITFPSGTTAERPIAPAPGSMRYNTTLNRIEYFLNSNWYQASDVYPDATGGIIVDVTIAGVPYRLHYFHTVGNTDFVVTKSGEIEYLIVAGGGAGGGGDVGAGGGAGGLLQGRVAVTPQTYTITVGGGGAGVASSSSKGGNGGNSSAFGFTAIGGGGGAGYGAGAGNSGGSGGGGSLTNAGGAGTAGQGNAGGSGGLGSPNYPQPGGGGAGAPGRAPPVSSVNIAPGAPNSTPYNRRAGDGGAGAAVNLSGTRYLYAGGGGGGQEANQDSTAALPGEGGPGGGGRGGRQTPNITAQAGAPGTGGGGGGEDPQAGGNGGSGIVIVRYPRNSLTPNSGNSIVTTNLRVEMDIADSRCYTGGITIRDRINGYNATLQTNNSYARNFYPGSHHSHLEFNGSSNYADLSTSAIPTGNEITIEFWNFGVELRQSSIISGTSNTSTSPQDLNIHLPWSNGTVYWDVGSPFNRIDKVATSAEYQGWHHWVFTKNAATGTMAIYLDGALWHSGTGLTSTIPAMTRVRIAAYQSLIYYHIGRIGLMRIYNSALSLSEVQQNFNVTRWRFGR